mmetsp:Transcript_57789/g.66511  ORF Transcript_57789/g.66511 Transcript_57789/m.66511 type:complete len:251 (+) Transcript_57789:872-1624(+)
MAAELDEGAGQRVAVEHDLACEALADFDLLREHIPVLVECLQRGDCHHLRDGAEEENGLVLQRRHVPNHGGHVLQSVRNHGVQALNRRPAVLHVLELVEVVRKGAPNVTRPEDTRGRFHDILQVIPNDVRLLQEEPHVVCVRQVVGEAWALVPTAGKEARQSMSDEASHVVAVQVVVLLGLYFGLEEVAHAHRHFVANVGDNDLVRLLQLLEFTRHTIVLLQEQFLMPLSNPIDTPREIVGFLVEEWQLG